MFVTKKRPRRYRRRCPLRKCACSDSFFVLCRRAVIHLLALGNEGLHIGKAVFHCRCRNRYVVFEHIVDGVLQTEIGKILGEADLRDVLEILGKVGRRQVDDRCDLVQRDLATVVLVDVRNGCFRVGEVALWQHHGIGGSAEAHAVFQQEVVDLVDIRDLNQRGIIVACVVDGCHFAEDRGDLRPDLRLLGNIEKHAVDRLAEHADILKREVDAQQAAAGAGNRTDKVYVLAVEEDEVSLLHDFEVAVAAALAGAFDHIHQLRLAVPLKLGDARV